MAKYKNSLRKIRKQRGLSQTRLARLCGYTRSYISLIETGRQKPSKRCRKAVAEALGVTIEDCFSKIS